MSTSAESASAGAGDAFQVLHHFSEATASWFRASFPAPTPAQEGAWNAIADSHNALVVAPTGSGKTLSAFLWSIDALYRSPDRRAGRTRVLYISPLKALGVDIERNLRSPIVGIGHTAARLEIDVEPISVGVRTGDTTAQQRRELVRNPPEILITTPESLYLMLTSKARQTLSSVDTVIIDEIHALAGTKRGAHLSLSLERLEHLRRQSADQLSDDDAEPSPLQRIGLSATVEPHDEIARFLGGKQPVQIIAPESQKQWDITLSVPVEDMSAPGQLPETSPDSDSTSTSNTDDAETPLTGDFDTSQPLQPSIWPHVEHRIVDLILENRSTIVFVNSRRLAEKLTSRLNEIYAERAAVLDQAATNSGSQETTGVLARAHHGSVSKDHRSDIEDDLKSGRLRCVVATSSLELGIDMGAVDLVIQVEAPHAVSAGLQRLGRAGHQVGEVSVGWFFPKHRGDLLSTAVVVDRMLNGRIEKMRIPSNPLDILAQQTVAAASIETLEVEDWYTAVRASAPFAQLPRSAFDACLDMLAGKYPSDRFSELRPRVIWDRDAGTLTGRPGAQRLAVTSGGTIPDRGLFGVYLVGAEDSKTGGRRVGELDEEMVYESRVGDVFALGSTSWRIEEITFDRVMVSPAFGQPASLPFWRGDGLGRPAELGEALGAFTRELSAATAETAHTRLSTLGLDEYAQTNLLRYLREQREATATVPSDTTLVIERTTDELGDWRIILHSPYGMAVHAPWALAIGERVHQEYGLDGAAFPSDDGIILRIPMMDADPPGAEIFLFEPEELEDLVTRQVSASALFAGRFREAAARALMLPRQNPGKRTPLWQQRQRSAQLLEVAHQYQDFPIIMETMREVLQDVYDLPALDQLIRSISSRTIRITEVTTETASPFAQSILFGYIAQFLYDGDSPLAERRAAALSVDPQLLNELLGKVELSDVLDAEVITDCIRYSQRLLPSRRLTGAEGIADLLRELGPLSAAELALRLNPAAGAEPHSTETAGADAAATEAQAAEVSDSETAPDSPEADAAVEAPASEEQAQEWAQQLVSAQRALSISYGGELRFAAVEDASRLRDGLGINIPPGVPQTFLEPVDDPLGDVVHRYARTHGPFTVGDAAHALSLPTAVVQRILDSAVQSHQVVAGFFDPQRKGTSEEQFCEAAMLQRIRRRSLAALRSAVEPVTQQAFAYHLTEWQQTTTSTMTEGVSGLREVLHQLSGYAAAASAWEALILPARVKDYQPAMLDELLGAGEFMVLGQGELSGHDGMILFCSPEDLDFVETTQPPQDELTERLLGVLDGGGAWFPDGLARHLGDLSSSAIRTRLWEMFWCGRLHPDSMAPLRHLLHGNTTTSKKTPAPVRRRPGRRPSLGGDRRRPSASASAGAASSGGLSASASAGAAPATSTRENLDVAAPSSAGSRKLKTSHQAAGQAAGESRWALVPGTEASRTPAPEHQQAHNTQATHIRAEILLGRYGLLTRGSVVAERIPGNFAAVYKILSAAEDAGQIRRGYFTEGLGAAQFTSSATIDRLREINEALEDQRLNEIIVLAATDPANPYGAGLEWPEHPTQAGRPARKAGAVVVLHNGALALYMERGGRTMLTFTDNESVREGGAVELVKSLRKAKTRTLSVERIDGEDAVFHPFAAALKTAGFRSTPSALRLSS